jgi:hypothetical protein
MKRQQLYDQNESIKNKYNAAGIVSFRRNNGANLTVSGLIKPQAMLVVPIPCFLFRQLCVPFGVI